MSKAVKLPAGIGMEANGKIVEFRLTNCEGTGVLSIWESPNEAGKHLVCIEIREQFGPPEKITFRFTIIEVSPHNVLLLRKSAPGMPHEYEILGGEAALPPAP